MNKTIFMQNLEKNKDKLLLFKKALSLGLIQPFDQEVLTKLRQLYFSCYQGLLYLYFEETSFSTIGNKMHLLSYVFKNEDYTIVHGNTDSTKEINFFEYNVEHLDHNSWIEVKRGNKVFVYDTFSMLKFDKDIYYQLEQPEIIRKSPKLYIESHPERSEEDFLRISDEWLLTGIIPQIEKKLDTHPYKDIIKPELTRFKEEVEYNNILLNWQKEENEIHRRS